MQVYDNCVERLGHDSGVRAGHECSALNGVTELAARLGYLNAGTESDYSKRQIPKELHELIVPPRDMDRTRFHRATSRCGSRFPECSTRQCSVRPGGDFRAVERERPRDQAGERASQVS